MSNKFQMVAKTLKGLEGVLANELRAIGATDIQEGRRAVSYTGDLRLLYKSNLCLRTALSVLKPISTFHASDPDEVYAAVKRIDWSQYLDLRTSFAVSSTVYSRQFHHSKFVAYRVKDAIADWFVEHTGKRPSVSVTNPDVQLNIHISDESCTLSLDSSGDALYRRGWRVGQDTAPINEVLAAGMLLMAGWDGQCDFVDPMCGSGTLLIEAAMIALNIPPGLYRKNFGFEHWKDFDAELFDTLYNDDSQERAFSHKIYGSDISHKAINIARDNVKNAGLAQYIELSVCGVADLQAPSGPCLIVTNPPYGERIKPESILGLYEELGSTLKHRFSGSQAWVISSLKEGIFKIGLRPSQKIELLNGDLECQYVQFELFDGKRSEYKSKRASATHTAGGQAQNKKIKRDKAPSDKIRGKSSPRKA
ncbi:MAG: RNA methyltransferase [Paludibacteraceae bacterium]|nr:RNA methyltransferase [Paludibacteraceae bacterium]